MAAFLRYSLALLLTLSAAGLVQAQPTSDGLTRQYDNCMDQSEGVTQAMVECMGQEYDIQDARLNAAYRQLRANLTDSRATQLRDVQRLWIQWRDANCGFYNDPEGGTLARVLANECMVTTTAQRAAELEQWMQH